MYVKLYNIMGSRRAIDYNTVRDLAVEVPTPRNLIALQDGECHKLRMCSDARIYK